MRVWRTLVTIIISFTSMLFRPFSLQLPCMYGILCCIIQNDKLIPQNLFTNEAMFTRNRKKNYRNSHLCFLESPSKVCSFSTHIFCKTYGTGLYIGLFVFEHCLTAERYPTSMKTARNMCCLWSGKVCTFSMMMHQHSMQDL